MSIAAGGNAPYAPPATVIDVIQRYRERGLTTPLTTEVIERAGVSPTLSRRTLQALKLLGFVDSDGAPSKEFEALSRAPEVEYKEMLGEFIAGTYIDVLSFADPATDSYDRVRDAFRAFNPKGQQERMVTLFLGLLEHAGLDISAAAGSRRRDPKVGPKKSTVAKKAAAGSVTAKRTTQVVTPDLGVHGTGDLPPGLLGLLQQIPRDGKTWSTARRDAFMAAFTAVLDFTIPLDDSPATHEGADP